MSSTKKKAASKASGGKKKPTKAKAKPSKKWNDKPKNKLVAFWLDEKEIKAFDAALKRHGFSSRAGFLKSMTDKLIEKAAPVKKAKAVKPKAAAPAQAA